MVDRDNSYPSAASPVRLAHAQALREEFDRQIEAIAADLPAPARRRDQLVDEGRVRVAMSHSAAGADRPHPPPWATGWCRPAR